MQLKFLGNIEFSKTNAEGRKRYKRKSKVNNPNNELLIRKDRRDGFKTKIKTVEEGRKWINTFLNLKRYFNN